MRWYLIGQHYEEHRDNDSDHGALAAACAPAPNMFAAAYPHHGREITVMHYLPPGSITAESSARLRK